MTRNQSISRALLAGLAVLCLSVASLSAEQFGLFTYEVNGDSVTITSYPDGAVGAVEIPAEIEGSPVTRIGNHAFEECIDLTDVTIPPSVTSIGAFAFEGCSSLTSVTIPEDVTSIGAYAFWECTGLTSVTIPGSVTSIGGAAFEGCSSLTSITIPEGVTSIGYSAFSGCTGLTNVTFPAWAGYPTLPRGYRLEISGVRPTGSGVSIEIRSLPGKTYALEFSFDLERWEEFDDNIESQGHLTTYTAELPMAPSPRRAYFRVLEVDS